MGDANGRVAGLRCVALVDPFASGKTSLLEAILARTGAIQRQGTVSQGNTVGDASPEARAHAMSVEANVAETTFMGDSYTFIDCPGSVEFLFEAQGVLAGADVAIVVAEPDEKKVAALQLILKELEERGVPHLLFIIKVDKFDRRLHDILTMLQPASSVPLVLRQISIRKDGNVTGFIDLALERAHIYQEHSESEVIDFPSAERERVLEARFEMLEAIADYDDGLMEKLLEDIQPGTDYVFTDLVKETRDGMICSVFIGLAEHGNGILRLMKALRHETPAIEQTRERLGLEEDAGSVVQVLKTFYTPHAGKLSIVRVLAGTVSDGTVLLRSDEQESRCPGCST